jgi:hypothetical protein
MGFMPVEVMQADRDNLTVRLAAPFTLEVQVEGLPLESTNRRGPALHLLPLDGPLEQQVDSGGPKNGKGLLEGVYPGRYRFFADARKGYYMDSAQGQEMELMEGAPPIHIVYKQDGGVVRGTVEEGSGSTVVLAPEAGSPDYWQSAKCDERGRFEVRDLRPGDYYAIAVRHPGVVQDPGFVSSIEREGTRVHVNGGETAAAELRVTTWPR